VLRDSLGFEGFVVTDDIRMGALQNDYDADERVVRALAAGADIVLTPDDLADAVAATKAALQRGFLDEAAIDRSVRRILYGKAQAGLHRKPEADEEQLAYLLERARGAPLAQVIAERAVTMLKTTPHLPLQPAQRTVLVQLSNVRESESIAAAMDSLAAILAPDAEARLGIRPSRTESSQVLRKVEGADVVVLALYLRLQSGRGKAGLHPGQEQVVRRLVEREEPLVLVTFGNPYAVTSFADADALVVAYEQTLESVRAVMNVLQGRQPARGKLPITVDPYPLGSGLSW
jgi:beta-N-acetylhexosaminidase